MECTKACLEIIAGRLHCKVNRTNKKVLGIPRTFLFYLKTFFEIDAIGKDFGVWKTIF